MIASMVQDVIEIIQELIKYFFIFFNEKWAHILNQLIQFFKALIPKTSTILKWITYRSKCIADIHSALYISNINKNEQAKIFHCDGSSIENVSFEVYGFCTREINNKIDYEMVSDFEYIKEHLNIHKHKKSSPTFLPHYDDHILAVSEVLYTIIIYVLSLCINLTF